MTPHDLLFQGFLEGLAKDAQDKEAVLGKIKKLLGMGLKRPVQHGKETTKALQSFLESTRQLSKKGKPPSVSWRADKGPMFERDPLGRKRQIKGL